jgi:beta-glucosidase
MDMFCFYQTPGKPEILIFITINNRQIMVFQKFFALIALLQIHASIFSQEKFIWATASASYQVEGAYQKDGKGLSNWDLYTNKYHVTKPFTGVNQTGNIAINAYDRKQYLQDIALMKKLGVNSYRFSISWARLLPEGTGNVNKKGVAHYAQFIDDLLANGIEPMVTLYHWDLPQALEEKGGWQNPEIVQWYENYANLVFKSYGKKVKKFITFNEPFINLFLIEPLVHNIIDKVNPLFQFTSEGQSKMALAAHHLLLANATAIRDYHQLNLDGLIGITLSLSPTIPLNENSEADIKAARIQDGLHNRWFLDALYKGRYPADILALYQHYNSSFKPLAADFNLFYENQPDFLGINFYAPAYVNADEKMAFGVNGFGNNPDTVKMFNGPVRPAYLYKLLMRLKNEYGNPLMFITENGAGFGERDEQLVKGKINDALRTDYIKRHIDTAMTARKDGANLQGYTVWSIFDNFEWAFGYKNRFGLVHVNFNTQQRIPKQSFYGYQSIIRKYKK